MDIHVGFSTTSLQIHQLNWRVSFITYLYNVSPTCFDVSHTIIRENLQVPYSKEHLLLTKVQWLRRPKWAAFPTWVTPFQNGIPSQWFKELRSFYGLRQRHCYKLAFTNQLQCTTTVYTKSHANLYTDAFRHLSNVLKMASIDVETHRCIK